MATLYKVADVFFFAFHICLIAFNLFAWMSYRLRKWNLITLAMTAFSWFGLGFFYGFGYCFLTDWHWQIRAALGYSNPFDSYIQFLIATLLGLTISEKIVNVLTASLFFAAFVMSILTNVNDIRKKKRTKAINDQRH